MLGKLYLTGQSVQPDQVQAIVWFGRSAEGNQYAQFFLERHDDIRPPSVMLAVTRLLYHMSRIFEDCSLPRSSTGLRIVYKLCMFPLLVGVCYEILKWAGRSHSVLSRIVSQPGLWMQRLTTFEPDDSMIEVAIAAVTPVLPENQEEARW